MKVITIIQGDMKSNTYVAIDEEKKEAVIVDPAQDPKEIQSAIKDLDLTVKAVLVTHGHFDHIGAVDALKEAYSCPVYASADEALIMADSVMNLSGYFSHTGIAATATNLVEDDDIITISPILRFKVIFVPGHSPDGVCYYNEENGIAFVGDTLMEGRIGSTDYYAGGSYDLITNIKDRLMTLPDETVIYSGHGKSTSIGHEKTHTHYFGRSMWI